MVEGSSCREEKNVGGSLHHRIISFYDLADGTFSLSLSLARGMARVYCEASLKPPCLKILDRSVEDTTHGEIRRTLQLL